MERAKLPKHLKDKLADLNRAIFARDGEAAAALYDEFVRGAPGYLLRPPVQFDLARILDQHEHFNLALHAYTAIIENQRDNPALPQALKHAGIAAYKLEKFESSLEYLEAFLETEPMRPDRAEAESVLSRLPPELQSRRQTNPEVAREAASGGAASWDQPERKVASDFEWKIGRKNSDGAGDAEDPPFERRSSSSQSRDEVIRLGSSFNVNVDLEPEDSPQAEPPVFQPDRVKPKTPAPPPPGQPPPPYYPGYGAPPHYQGPAMPHGYYPYPFVDPATGRPVPPPAGFPAPPPGFVYPGQPGMAPPPSQNADVPDAPPDKGRRTFGVTKGAPPATPSTPEETLEQRYGRLRDAEFALLLPVGKRIRLEAVAEMVAKRESTGEEEASKRVLRRKGIVYDELTFNDVVNLHPLVEECRQALVFVVVPRHLKPYDHYAVLGAEMRPQGLKLTTASSVRRLRWEDIKLVNCGQVVQEVVVTLLGCDPVREYRLSNLTFNYRTFSPAGLTDFRAGVKEFLETITPKAPSAVLSHTVQNLLKGRSIVPQPFASDREFAYYNRWILYSHYGEVVDSAELVELSRESSDW